MAIDDGTSVTTKLLTLLNVSATRLGKRKIEAEEFVPAPKLNKRKSITFSDNVSVKLLVSEDATAAAVEGDKDVSKADGSKAEEASMEVDDDADVGGTLAKVYR